MTDALPLEGFYDLVASYGADPDRWPAEARRGAVRCLVESGSARAAWREACELDAALDVVPAAHVSSELVQRTTAIGDAGILPGVVPYAAAAAIALIVGLAVPSPFRDGATPPTPVIAPEIASAPVAETPVDLTALALVDANGFADSDDITADDAGAGAGGLLADLPLL